MLQETSDNSRGGDGRFEKTHWTMILAAGDLASPNNEQAREQVCQAYWRPVYAFARKRGKSPHDAEDLTQTFFAWILEKNKLGGLRREGGRFRSWLRKLLENFLAREWNEVHTLKRGGGRVHIPFDETTETHCQRDLSEEATPETMFDRQWAIAVLDQVLGRLRDECAAEGKQRLFECLEGCFPGSSKPFSYSGAAQALGLTETAVRMAASRLRQRFRMLLRQEVATSGTPPEEIDEEIRYLLTVLSRG
jgi:RNA polymerase sigma factor (sigma-70 family)